MACVTFMSWCVMYGLASNLPSVVIYMNYLNVVGGCHISKTSQQLKYWIWIEMYQCMTSFASEFLRMNLIAVSMVMNRPRGSTRHTQGRIYHDDVIKWKHFPRYWPFVRGIHRSFTGPRWIPRTKTSDAEFWCFLWFNNGYAGDLRRNLADYDVIVMWYSRTKMKNTEAHHVTTKKYAHSAF